MGRKSRPCPKRISLSHRIPFKTNLFRGFTTMTKTMRGQTGAMTLAAVMVVMGTAVGYAQQSHAPASSSAPVAPPSQPRPPGTTSAPFTQPLGFAWWKSDPFKTELGLTADQTARIDKIWETTRPELRQEWDELQRLEEKLSRMIQNDADEASLARQIDRVETARANTNKTRSLMLVQMVKTLSPDQRLRFKALNERWQQDLQHRPSADPRKPRDH
jgi:Spy/CpxP family protein refolding chaperone